MTAAAPEKRIRKAEGRGAVPGVGLQRELAEIVERAEQASELEGSQVEPWFYRVPFPGVRYYLHWDRPDTEEPAGPSGPGHN